MKGRDAMLRLLLLPALALSGCSFSGDAAREAAYAFGAQIREWKPIDPETARALRPEIRVIDEGAARVIGESVERTILGVVTRQTPPGVPTTADYWGGIGGLASLYVANQLRKWWISREVNR